MARYWPTLGFKRRTFKLCVLIRWDFNFCTHNSPLLGTGIRDLKEMMQTMIQQNKIEKKIKTLNFASQMMECLIPDDHKYCNTRLNKKNWYTLRHEYFTSQNDFYETETINNTHKACFLRHSKNTPINLRIRYYQPWSVHGCLFPTFIFSSSCEKWTRNNNRNYAHWRHIEEGGWGGYDWE